MDLSIIIVNWNSKDYLIKCLASIIEKTKGINFEILVIDSASFDGSGDVLRHSYPQVRFIQSTINLGFAKANNIAFQESCGQFVLFLNPDTELVNAAINIMFNYLQRLPNAGVVGCKLLNADGTLQTSCVQSFPTVLNQLLNSDILRSLWPHSFFWGTEALFSAENTPKEVQVLSGACMMMKRELFEVVGFFCEDYFMYSEDIDLCYKIKQAEYINYYIPLATITHFGGGSTQRRTSDFSVVLMRDSIWRFLCKTRGNIYGIGYRISVLSSAIGRMLLLFIFFPLYFIRGKYELWTVSLGKWKAILKWSIGYKMC